MHPQTPVILKTKNYEKFNFIDFNRALSPSNLKKLLDLNKEDFQLHNFPIVVDEELNIIDGQHRFKVSEMLESPIYYIVDVKIKPDVDTIHKLNIAGKRHTLADKVKMYAKDGKPGCSFIIRIYGKLSNKWSLSTVTECLTLLGGQSNLHLDKYKDLKVTLDGGRLLEYLDSFNNKRMHQNRAVRGFVKVFHNYPDIDSELVFDKFRRQQYKYPNLASLNDFYKAIVESYNHGRTIKNRLDLIM